MRKILFAACLLFSLSAHADYIQDWNKRFSELNNVPYDAKQAPGPQQSYFRVLISQRPDFFKNPDNYPNLVSPPVVAPMPPAPYVIPVVVQSDTVRSLINRIKADISALDKQFQ